MEPEDLYGLPLDHFISERAALAKALRAAGRRDEAARVAALRKPSVAAWAVNQLIRTQRAAVAELFAAGDAVSEAQSALLAGRGEAVALHEATRAQRAAADELRRLARGLLDPAGQELSAVTLERVGETLRAAALDADAREQVAGGCLERELRHAGLGGLLAGGGLEGPPPAPGRVRGPAPAGRGAQASERDAEAERERRKRERDAALTAARQTESAARREAERAARALHAAQQRRDHVARALDEADAGLAQARERADAAEQALGEAEQAREQL